MNKIALKLIHDTQLQFLFLFTNADEFYVSSRYSLSHGFLAPGCLNFHQAIELYIKAILKLENVPFHGHKLITILNKHQNIDPYFKFLANHEIYSNLLHEVSVAYEKFRYGEFGARADSSTLLQFLDEISFNLRNVYLTKINSPSKKIHIPYNMRSDFLKMNKWFNETDLTNTMLGILSGYELPEDFFKN